jgi:hypothetical protein
MTITHDDYKLKLIEEYDKTLKKVENNICKETKEIVNDYQDIKNKYNSLIVYLFLAFIFLPNLLYISYKLYEGYLDRILIHKLLKRIKHKNNSIRHYQALLQEKWDMKNDKAIKSYVSFENQIMNQNKSSFYYPELIFIFCVGLYLINLGNKRRKLNNSKQN